MMDRMYPFKGRWFSLFVETMFSLTMTKVNKQTLNMGTNLYIYGIFNIYLNNDQLLWV